ncbi:TonB-dependent siderophore receptor [Luteolibacter sp. LG18]|uniref:TonB-dependent receptor n=1 Tax=Luteolibacter sp. LG18 TaxID=2819286 RepID=UPI002B29C312|nr:catecholate siderophore receptor Fiu [Luteolibacter sp. LG18]
MVVEAVRQSLYRPENVTSQKYTVPLRDVPQTVTVVPKKVIEDQGATSLTEVLRNVPGISIQAGEGGGASSTAGDMFTMRGFNASNSIFVDGVRDDGLGTRDTYNLEAVETFLGPTGSDVGRGTASGYVNMATKTPKLEDFYAGSVAYASGDRFRNTVDVNQSLAFGDEGSWTRGTAMRLNGLYQSGGVAGRDYVEKNSWALAPSFVLGLDTPTRVFLQYQHSEQDNLPDYGLPARNGYPIPVPRDTYYGNVYADFDNVTQDAGTIRIEHDLNDHITIRNQTRYSEAERFAVVSGLGYNAGTNTVTRSRQGNDRENKIFSNQTSITAKFDTGPLKHSLVGGLEYTWDEQYSPTITGVGTNPTGLPYPWIPNPYQPIVGYNPQRHPTYHTIGSTDTVGTYLFDTIEFGEHWQLSGGGRFDSYKTRYTAVSATSASNPDGLVYQTSDDVLFSGKIALTYKPVKEGSIYLGYGTSQTPPGTANFTLSESGTNQNSPNLDPQESTNVELGAKWDFFKSALTVTGAVFHTENKNVIYALPSSGPTTEYSVDGGQEINGATFGVAGKITEEWQVLANATIMHGELDQKGAANNGKDLTLMPKISGSLWTTYKLPYNFTVGAGVRYQESVFVNAANTIKVPSYAVVDAMVQYDFTKDINVRANIYNLLDREYISSINNNGQRYNPGAPASFMISTNFKF